MISRSLPLVFMALLTAAPLIALLLSWGRLDSQLWSHLIDTQLWTLFANTFFLATGVVTVVTILSVPLAWLTATCDFPGRKYFEWSLVLPLAIPTYVYAFLVLGFLDFTGPVQALFQSLGYQGYIDIRSPWLVVWVMSAVLYPYSYLLLRHSFRSRGRKTIEMGQSLGVPPVRAFFTLLLPSTKFVYITGMMLILMETLSDFGAVSLLGYQTFTTAIYKSWIGFFSLDTAAQLSTLLLLLILFLVIGERSVRNTKAEDAGKVEVALPRFTLSSGQQVFAFIYCAIVSLLTLILPLAQMIYLAWPQMPMVHYLSLLNLLGNSTIIAALALFPIVLFAIAGAYTQRYRAMSKIEEIAGLGYAIPGAVLAIGILMCFGAWDSMVRQIFFANENSSQVFLVGSLVGLVVAHMVRFFRPAFGAIQTSMSSIKKSYLESAQLLNSSKQAVWQKIVIPLLTPGIFTAVLIVFIEVAKEMPATLLLRPFGWDTLATKLYELTGEGEWERAAVPALLLVLLSLIPVMMLIRQTRMREADAA